VLAASLTLSAATGVFALSFGVLAVGAGASVLQACVLSLATFTGASQMSAMSVVAAGGGLGAALGGSLLLAARNGVYGLVLAPRFGGRLPLRLVAAQFVIDETTAMMTAQRDRRLASIAFWSTAIALFTCWNLGTLAGALIGGAIDGGDGAGKGALIGGAGGAVVTGATTSDRWEKVYRRAYADCRAS